MAKLPDYYKVSVDGLTVKLDPIYEEMAEVVRCKDCKHFCKAGGLLDYDYCSQNYDCDGTHSETYPDDFCSCGERREGE